MAALRARRRLVLEFDSGDALTAFVAELRDAEIILGSVELQRRAGERAHGLGFPDGARAVFVPPSNVVPFRRRHGR